MYKVSVIILKSLQEADIKVFCGASPVKVVFLNFSSKFLNYNKVEREKNNLNFAVILIADDFVCNKCLCGIMKRKVFQMCPRFKCLSDG